MIFLNGIRSEISGTPMNKTPSNLSKGELTALKSLITLQKGRVIVIKPCDKGGGILITDFEKYEESCLSHLTSKTETGLPYIRK